MISTDHIIISFNQLAPLVFGLVSENSTAGTAPFLGRYKTAPTLLHKRCHGNHGFLFRYYESVERLSKLHSKCNRQIIFRYCLTEEGLSFGLGTLRTWQLLRPRQAQAQYPTVHRKLCMTLDVVSKSSSCYLKRLLLYLEPLPGPTAYSGWPPHLATKYWKALMDIGFCKCGNGIVLWCQWLSSWIK